MARTANLSLVGRLYRSFANDVRTHGSEYAIDRKVQVERGDANEVVARVVGSDRHKVRLTRDGLKLVAYCSCPFVSRAAEPCKHIWATIITADELNYLREPGGVLPDRIQLDRSIVNDEVDEDYYNEWDDDDWEDEPATIPIRPPAQPPERSGVRPPTVPLNQPAPPPPAVSPWRRQIARVRASAVQAATPPDTRRQSWPPGREILYHIDVDATLKTNRLVLEVLHRDRKMNGDWCKPKSRKMSTEEISRLPDPADRHIISMLVGAHESPSYFSSYSYCYSHTTALRFSLPQAMCAPITELACRTGRCVVRSRTSDGEFRPLAWDDGGTWEFCLSVEPDATGKYYDLSASVARGSERLPIASPVWFLFDNLMFTQDRVARLEHFGAIGWFQFISSSEKLTVPVKEGVDLVTELLAMPKLPRLDLPDELRFEEVMLAPRPCLKVHSPDNKHYYGARNLLASLAFDYDGVLIPNDDPRDLIVRADRRHMMRRDPAAEAAAFDKLRQLGFKPASYWTREEASLELVPKRLPHAVSELLASGWHVEAEGKLYRRPGEIKIEVSSGIDWFELNGSVEYGETKASLPTLLAALKKGDGSVLLDDGTLGSLPEEWLKKYGVLAGLGKADGDSLRFTRSQVGLLDALLASQPEAKCDEVFTRARDELARFHGVKPLDAPSGFVGELRPYQRDGMGWMQFLQNFTFGGCLADDMGLGKTVQVLALLEARRVLRASPESRLDSSSTQRPKPTGNNGGHANSKAASPVASRPGPSLVVVPKSLVFNWKAEAARFTPELRVLDHTGVDRAKGTGHFDNFDVVLTTYGTLRRDAIAFKDARFDYVILDESQAVKNAGTESAKAVRLLRCDHRLALSGTPVENHLGELWSLFDFLNPGMLGAASVLRLGGAGARNPDPATRELLARALRPFILRRTKEQVAKDLPPKLEQTIYCELESDQRKLYDELRDHYRNTLLDRVARDGINKSKIQILEALLRLRQAACHPGLIDRSRTAEPCAKLDVLLPQLAEVVDEGHKVLVFSQFTSLLAIVRNRLDADKVVYEYLDGKTRDRKSKVERFQTDPACKLFLVSLKAGGLGLNLTAADYVFLLDPWWNPAVESQAIDRAHRIGQTRQVFAYRLIARDTVEEKVLELQQTKRNLADAIINADNSLIRNLGREDLELLLS